VLAFVRAHPRALGAAALVLVLVIGLIASGAFGGGGGTPATTPSTTTSPSTTTTPTTTAPATSPVPAPTATLAPGASGTQVSVLQRALRSLGFYTGPIDGSYGPKTQQAVSAFQRSAGLTADGVFGPATLKKLTTALHSG
jgi:peptidoglycan hydrolase-like protein with peptidoglycan-binding domain